MGRIRRPSTISRPAIIDARGNHATSCAQLADCHKHIAEFLGIPIAELSEFKMPSRAQAHGRKSFEAYEKHGRIYEIVKLRKAVERRSGRPKNVSD